MNAAKLQLVVDRAQFKIENDKKIWYLSENDAKDFVGCVDKYIKKSVFRSDYYDPEDAYGEVLLELWRCLTKYGPRPNGKLFGEYVLPLKTNNVLTNRANKRKSFKSRANYMTSPMDTAHIDTFSFDLPFDRRAAAEDIADFQKNIIADKKITALYKRIKRETEQLSKANLKTFTSLYFDFILKSSPVLVELIRDKIGGSDKFTKLSTSLYNKGKAFCLEGHMKEVKVGDKLITPGGKVIEIRRKIEGGYIVHVPLIEQEAEVDVAYIERCNVYDSIDVAAETESNVEQHLEETKQLKVYAKQIVEEEKKSLDYIVVNETDAGAATKVIVELLRLGPQSRELLARALVSKGLSKSNDVEKAKGYVSVLITNLKREDVLKISSPKRGVYALVS